LARKKNFDSQNKPNKPKNKITSNSKSKNNYKFEKDEKVFYVGKLFDEHINKEAIILGCSHSKGFNYYNVKFIHDGKELSFKENLLRGKFEQINIEDLIKDKEREEMNNGNTN